MATAMRSGRASRPQKYPSVVDSVEPQPPEISTTRYMDRICHSFNGLIDEEVMGEGLTRTPIQLSAIAAASVVQFLFPCVSLVQTSGRRARMRKSMRVKRRVKMAKEASWRMRPTRKIWMFRSALDSAMY